MLNKYKVKLVKKYIFVLDGVSEKNVREQVDYIKNREDLLRLPDVEKTVCINVKQIKNIW